jgi:hypothetical protein
VLLASDVLGDRALLAITGVHDPRDQEASMSVRAGPRRAQGRDGTVEAVRVLMVARRGAARERTQTAAYPDGRALTDDVFSARMAFLANAEPGSDGTDRTTISWPSFLFPGPTDP